MSSTIRLLGEPVILDRDGLLRPVRGHQAWALLARVLLARRPLDRRSLAAELFPETADPLGSLRWCLASLRQALDSSDSLRGDPLEPNLCPGIHVDVWHLDRDDFDIEQAGALLGTFAPRCSPEFSTWLLIERERIAAIVDARVRQDTIRALAVEDYERAIRLAELGVRREPLTEAAHILLTKSLALAGRQKAALAHVAVTEELFLEELGERPSPDLRAAARQPVMASPSGISTAAYVQSMLRSGLAALAAGVVDVGIEQLRRALRDAERTGDGHLTAMTKMELGTAMVHACRGHDGEAAILLQQAMTLARGAGRVAIASSALRELGYVEALAGQRLAADGYLAAAAEIARGDESLAGIRAFQGFNLIGRGDHDGGLRRLEQALGHARAAGNRRNQCWALAIGAWGLLRAGRLAEAEGWIAGALVLVEAEHWIAFRPWAIAVAGEIRLRRGADPAALRPGLEEAFALACQLDDTSWEAACAKVIGLTYAETGEMQRAQLWLSDALKRSTRNTKRPTTVQVEVLQSKVEVCLRQDDFVAAEALAREWIAVAARMQMDAHVARAAEVIAQIRPPLEAVQGARRPQAYA
ncbi:DNA-binding transcriptional activator of the SARP family [Tistlia consotensis]|uniref:DNA-binding transcriptional activator of the SARP family n=1 Tax=Tistlia consotensis USBA 355 TaxID=560819 RepID=A0A1Y6C3H3_9PROT|nr:BTAD domain-containing putative transcriptional regulator [Tistlia consotensis]SMF41908.1 DNA-binding transcriptional activator of the SARP family [Tistlia consotensis USBA 355]SNR73228.1 DNA-binding transcriptional activator of the SARP family [Tistlia consotensis]